MSPVDGSADVKNAGGTGDVQARTHDELEMNGRNTAQRERVWLNASECTG